MKLCVTCGKHKDPDRDFHKNKARKDGLQNFCKDCNSLKVRAHYLRDPAYYKTRSAKRAKIEVDRQRKLAIRFLLDHPCVDCGEKDVRVLDFDHVRGNKIKNVSRMIGGVSDLRLLAEIEKCEVRCANCHRKRTATQLGWYKRLFTPSVTGECGRLLSDVEVGSIPTG